MTPKPSLRAVIACARRYERTYGWPRRRAVKAAYDYMVKHPSYVPGKVVGAPKDQARSEMALEYLQHRTRSQSTWRPA